MALHQSASLCSAHSRRSRWRAKKLHARPHQGVLTRDDQRNGSLIGFYAHYLSPGVAAESGAAPFVSVLMP